MFKVICVTCRSLAGDDFLGKIGEICGGEARPDKIILREKDLTKEDYFALAREILPVCGGVPLSVHSFFDYDGGDIFGDIHLSLSLFTSPEFQRARGRFNTVGVSVHSAAEAKAAVERGADYLIAGHIFATGCKRGVPPRGVDFLREVCAVSEKPVYAIGGITPDNAGLCAQAGAAGVCVMSSLMRCDVPGGYIEELREGMERI